MSYIENYLNEINKTRKALSVFLTAGFPGKDGFEDLVLDVFNSGADLIELGIPFSDPLADGSTIQASSQVALENNIDISSILEKVASITSKTDKPIILMGYANPILNYGIEKFFADAEQAGVKGLIIPDVPVDEYDSFYNNISTAIDIVLLTTPTSTEERIKTIDGRSSGFVYCVSVTGTTGTREGFSDEIISNIDRTYKIVSKNKMLVGFGISKPEHILQLKSHCDGIIVGSAVIKLLKENPGQIKTYIKSLSEACRL